MLINFLPFQRVVRVLLSHLTLTVPGEVAWLQELLRPLLHTLLLKCADGNRRTSQISVDSLLELSRGQEGELALGGRQGLGLGGVQYVLSCILDEPPPQEAPWQWLLGRLCVLNRLLDQFPEQFQLQMVSLQPLESGYKLQHYDRLMTVVEFAFKALGSSHATVATLARRVYICGARMAAAEPNVFRHVCDMLGKLDISLQMRLKRRLRSLQNQHPRPTFGKLNDVHHKPRSQIEASLRQSYMSTPLPRLVRSVSHSPSRLSSAAGGRSPSHSPSREQQQQAPSPPPSPSVSSAHQQHPQVPLREQPLATQQLKLAEPPPQPQQQQQVLSNQQHNIPIIDLPQASTSSGDSSNKREGEETKQSHQLPKQSLPRPNHLPLDSLHIKFKDKQARVRQYHKSRPRQEEPIIVQHALITPKPHKSHHKAPNNNNRASGSNKQQHHQQQKQHENRERFKGGPLRKGGLSQSHGDNLDLSPRTPVGPPIPNFTLKEAIASPTTPNAPFTTPVKEVTHPILSEKLQSDIDKLENEGKSGSSREPLEQPLPTIPNLTLLPPYLQYDVGSSQERVSS